MQWNYRAFGLTLGSELALPGLPASDSEPDVAIRRAVVPEWQGEPDVQYGERFRIRPQESLIHFSAVSFKGLVQNGNLIRFEADPADDDISALHVLGSCTGALLFQRGLTPLHGNTVATTIGAAMIVGRIGTGKSTTTMALIRRGYSLVADDISPLSFEAPDPRVLPGFPRVKLWQPALEQFQIDYSGFRRVRAGIDKYQCPVTDNFCSEPRPLEAIYILNPGEFPKVNLSPLAGLQKLEALRPHLYKVHFRDAIRLWPPLLGKLCRLVDTVRVVMVDRPAAGTSIDEVADAIARDIPVSAPAIGASV